MPDWISPKQFHECEGVEDSTAEVIPLWRAALGYEPRRDSPAQDLVDPRGRRPGFWFEQMKTPPADDGGTVYVAIWVPAEQAESRRGCARRRRPRGA